MRETTITTKARRASLRDITSGKIDVVPKITKIAFGSGGVDSEGDPLAPPETQAALKDPITKGGFNMAGRGTTEGV